MKKFIKAISGKKAMMTLLVLVSICSVLEVITSIRLGTRIAFTPLGLIFSCLAVWADSLEKDEKKAKAEAEEA